MIVFLQSIQFINVIFCCIIVILGLTWYKKSKNLLARYLTIAYIFYGLSHLISLINSPLTVVSYFILFLRFGGFFILIAGLSTLFKYRWYIGIISTGINIGLIFTLSFIFEKIPLIFIFNLLFGIQIIILSFLGYREKSLNFSIYLGAAYFLFATAHLMSLLEIHTIFTVAIIIIRLIAYLIVITALYSLVKKETIIFLEKNLTNVKVQTGIIGLSMLVLIILFYFPHLRFNCSDPLIQILPITPTISDRQITKVNTGLYIKNFPLFDVANNEFIIDGILWFEFDPHAISLEAIKKFSFEKGTILNKTEPETKIINDRLFSTFKLTIRFKSDLDYKFFPLEDHRINIVLTNTFLNPSEVVLISNNTDLTTKGKIFTGDWIMINAKVNNGYLKTEIAKDPQKIATNPAVLFSLNFKKAGFKKTLIVFIPLFIAFFLSLFSLVINMLNISGVLSLSVGSITSLIINLFTLEKMVPNVRYFTLADIIFNLLLIVVFSIFVINIYLIKQVKKDKVSNNLLLFRGYIFLFFIIIVPLIIYYFLY